LTKTYHGSRVTGHQVAYQDFTFPVSSIKAEVKKKHPSIGRNCSCFSAHQIEQDLF
jgi:hypothetical protein